MLFFFFFSSRRRHTRLQGDWSSDVCSSDLFLLYSCFFVLNDTILESRLHRYTALWNLLGTLSFLASLVIWNWALREKQPEATLAPEMLSDDVYRQMTPEINSRLRALNDQLNDFWHAEGKRS